MRSQAILSLTVLASLACGGLPALQDTPCGADEIHPTVELAALEGATAPSGDLLVEITPAGFRIDGEDAGGTSAAFQTDLADARDEQRARVGDQISDVVLLAVAADATGERVVSALEMLRAAEVTRVQFVLRSPHPRDPVTFLDPEYAAELSARLDSLEPNMRMAGLAAELDGLLVACPSGQTVLSAAAMASSDTRCELLVAGMDDALATCPVTSGTKVATALQVGFQPLPYELVALDLTLAPDGAPFAVAGDATWAEIAAQWQPNSGTSAIWVLGDEGVEGDEGDEATREPRRPAPTTAPRPAKAPKPSPRGPLEVSGGLDRSLAARALRRHCCCSP